MEREDIEYRQEYQKKLEEIIERLENHYGKPDRPEIDDKIRLVIKTILSQNTNDKNRDKAMYRFDRRFSSYKKALEADKEEIVEAIKVAGLGPTKAERIKKFLRRVKKERGEFSIDHIQDMSKEEGVEYLKSFPGIGPKTAAVILNFGFEAPAFPVDTHVYRVTKRLGLIPENVSKKKAQEILEREVPDSRKYEFHKNLIKHGREICTSKNPNCQEDFLCDLCNYCSCKKD